MGAAMDQKEIDTFLVLADISGYTDFMSFNRQEITHAQHVVSALIEAVLDAAPDNLIANKLEGDAIFLHAPDGQDAGRKVAQAAVRFFDAFDDKRRQMVLTNACPCRACARIRLLDLKVLVHFGRALLYRLKRFEELSGFDVVLAHRLLKNSVPSRRYLLASRPAWERFADAGPENARAHNEAYEGVGMIESMVALIPADPALLPDDVAPARGWARLKDIAVKHAAEFLFPLGLRKPPGWGDLNP
ncbi:conserved hypothetical protein [Rhodospirillaceae bacterium LM-1]|nr:conserved hypothetical protein [Rhodospirillaceae bacterium LM-1]